MTKQMHLSVDLSFTHADGKWRVPGSWVGADYPDLGLYKEIAMIVERGCFDMIFWGDGTGIPDTWQGSLEEGVRWGVQWPRLDMTPFIAVMAQETKHVGFTLTYSSTFMHPFYVARLLNSLDHVTHGRIALNVVATTRLSDFGNYGVEMDDHDGRYDRMEEFIDVAKALWNSVEPDAIVRNRETGEFADPTKIHAINHVGKHFKVRGPLNVIPSPQLHPVLINAGASPRGVRASARFADVIFGTGGQLPMIRERRKQLDDMLIDEGRDPAYVGVQAAVPVTVGRTRAEAEAKRAVYSQALPFEAVGAYISHNLGFDFSVLPETFIFGEIAERIVKAQASQAGLLFEMMRERGADAECTRQEFFEFCYKSINGGSSGAIVGTPAEVADVLEERFEAMGERGGFMFTGATPVPGAIADIVNLLVPELQRRGRARTKYEGNTLRENLGVPPVNTNQRRREMATVA